MNVVIVGIALLSYVGAGSMHWEMMKSKWDEIDALLWDMPLLCVHGSVRRALWIIAFVSLWPLVLAIGSFNARCIRQGAQL